MQDHLLDVLICPKTGQPFDLLTIDKGIEGRTETGFLFTQDRFTYPIIRGVPRLIEGSMKLFEKDLIKYKTHWKKIEPSNDSFQLSSEFKKQFLPTLRQFEKEWSNHDLEGKTWGWDQEKRLKMYLEYMGMESGDYSGKNFLDLGAGTGQFTCTLSSELKGNVIGVDLSPAVEVGEKLRKQHFPDAEVNFVQSNLMALPFKEKTFDYLHASGVLHHTPDTEKAFDRVEPMVKKGGKYGVWIYRKATTLIPLIPFVNKRKTQVSADKLRPYTSKMNPDILYAIIYLYSAGFHFAYKVNEIIRGRKHDQSISERTTSLFDTLAPSYVHKHEVQEVWSWFNQKGYSNLIETDKDNVSGFNITGTKT